MERDGMRDECPWQDKRLISRRLIK